MDHNSSDEDWSDVEETEHHEHHPILCLFCKETFSATDKCLGHMVDSHNFDIVTFCKINNIDFYGFIKFVNFLRARALDQDSARGLRVEDFSSDEFLKPVLADDGMLQIDFEGIMENCIANGGHPAEDNDTKSLKEKLKEAEKRALLAEGSLARAVTDLNKFKKEMHDLLLKTPHEEKGEEGLYVGVHDESRAYFESYAHHSIHEEMLKDEVRTGSYRDFILKNRDIFKDKIILDIGCGTGILSMFAARAGARIVIAVDQSDIAYQAMDIVRENGLQDVVKVIKGDAEKIKMPEGIEKVDLIISEWMGYFLLFESMLDSVIRCRDKWLHKDGLMFPDMCQIVLAAVSDEETWNSKVGFWSEVYGYKMTCMKKYVLEEPLIEVVPSKCLCSNAVEVLSVDCNKVISMELDFEKEFQMQVTKSGPCTGIVGYFNVGFCKDAANPIKFSTGCDAKPTHWKQTLFLFEEKVDVTAGECLSGKINCKKDCKDKRALVIKLNIKRENGTVIVDRSYILT